MRALWALCWLLWINVSAAAVVGLPDWMPWGEQDQNGHKRGFFVDVLSYLMAAETPPVVLKLVPGNRLVRGYSIREWDYGVFFCAPGLEKYFSLGHLIVVEQALMVRSDSPYQKEEDLLKAIVVKPRITMSLPLAIETRAGIQIVTADTMLDALRMVKAQHADAAYDFKSGSRLAGT